MAALLYRTGKAPHLRMVRGLGSKRSRASGERSELPREDQSSIEPFLLTLAICYCIELAFRLLLIDNFC